MLSSKEPYVGRVILSKSERPRNCSYARALHEPDELREAKIEKDSSTLFTTETRRTRRCTENPDVSVKSPCPPCLRGETGHVAAAGSLSESQLRHCPLPEGEAFP